MPPCQFVLHPEFIVEPSGQIISGPLLIENGFIMATGKKAELKDATPVFLKNRALLRGFSNAHSHAFQRFLRGRVEKKEGGEKDANFWTWRNHMYALANQLTPKEIELFATLCYGEMLLSGFVEVGEFHYLHHEPDGTPYEPCPKTSLALALAAQKVGIKLCLLETAYHQAGFNKTAEPFQRRFTFEKLTDYVDFIACSKDALRSTSAHMGLAIHSVRAVPKEWFAPIAELSQSQNLPLHIHAAEQLQEVKDCRNAYGVSPIELLNRHHALGTHTTLIHGIFVDSNDIELIANQKARICLCPSTEKNLGDGLAPILSFFQNKIPVCLGTDQNVRIDPVDEVRSLEENERLRLGQRHILTQNHQWLHEALLPSLISHGHKALFLTDLPNSFLNQEANLISIELPLEYQWHGPKAALDAWILSATGSSIKDVWCQGHRVVQDGRLLTQDMDLIKKEIGHYFLKFLS